MQTFGYSGSKGSCPVIYLEVTRMILAVHWYCERRIPGSQLTQTISETAVLRVVPEVQILPILLLLCVPSTKLQTMRILDRGI